MSKKTPIEQLLDTRKKPTFLLGPLERFLQLNPEVSERKSDVLHPSEICKSDWCIRASWFLLNGAPTTESVVGLRLRSIFDEGHAIHNKWQSWLVRMDALVGAWRCDDHGDWWGKRSDSCTTCPRVEYREVPILHEDYLIEGHADGWLRSPHFDGEALLEIKSIGTGTIRSLGGKLRNSLSASFRDIQRPFNSHVRQAMLYRECLQWMYDNGFIPDSPPDRVLFIYECKENQEPKEFLVHYHPDYLEATMEKLDVLMAATEALVPPACTGKTSADGHCDACKGFV